MSFLGRDYEKQLLQKEVAKGDSTFTVIWGRRRVGKTRLIQEAFKDKPVLYFTGGRLEPTSEQIGRFIHEWARYYNDLTLTYYHPETWNGVFELVDKKIGPKKLILVFDEFQWTAEQAPQIMSDLQRFWDTKWEHQRKTDIILCGSSISFMTQKLLSSKAPLFGRATLKFELQSLPPQESFLFYPRRSLREKMEAILILGGIPAYLSLLDSSQSLRQNINRLAFTADGYLVGEINEIFREQFKKPLLYEEILSLLAQSKSGLSQTEIADALGKKTGGISYNLKNLTLLRFIDKKWPITKKASAKTIKHKIADEYLRFYYSFIHDNLFLISNNRMTPRGARYIFDEITQNRWSSFCGIAFESFCQRPEVVGLVLKALGAEGLGIKAGTYWQKTTDYQRGIQIDMVIERKDKVTNLVECKFWDQKIGASIIKELEEKKRLYPNPKKHHLESVLIAPFGASTVVKESEAVRLLTLNDLFR